ncbi:hypothetical protein QWY97_10545 [Vibrio cortegadensis]|uniref:hypothetical protein n=1 Tax=Vibrio cortegadensis TaxID=1328770 RepID=UPI0021C2E684|nr:hypothetical protein [Vibrio cortegadensis]MDN3697784.1 hypothetical protein [Vibrio cortegadensis]
MLKLKQTSTWRGLVLLGSVIAASSGYGHLFSAEITQTGVNLGGAVGLAIPAVVGLWEAFRDELKGKGGDDGKHAV